jgi:hypothetical protein
MDHHLTKLRIKGPSDQYAIMSDIAVVLGSSASCKKSHMEKVFNNLLIQHSDLDVYNSPAVSLGHGNIKRVRRCLQQTRSANITSPDPIHIIRTPYLKDYDSGHLLPRTLINTWTQGEEDEFVMNQGKMNLKDYKFKFLMLGQIKVAEYICRPQMQGLQTRITMCFQPANVMEDDNQDSQMSMQLIEDVHHYMQRFEKQRIRKPYYSGTALSMWYQFNQSVADWIRNHKTYICEYSLAKLELRDSDVLRMAYVIQKLLRASTIMSAATDNKELLASDEIGLIALGAALRSWRRQVHIHFAYYKFLRTNCDSGMKEAGLMQMWLSEYLDSHRDSALESVRSIPLCYMDQI